MYEKIIVKEGRDHCILNQYGLGTDVYLKQDLRTHDGYLALEESENPNNLIRNRIGKENKVLE